ncbi:MAG: ParB/RepB/Spo0J family partition protein [Acidithiobacillus sp.]
MAKIDRSKNLFNQIEEELASIGVEDGAAHRSPHKDVAGDRSETTGAPTDLAMFLALEDVEPDPDQPRRSFDASDNAEGANDLNMLMESILQHGVLQPIAVRRMEAGKYRIVAGERRWRASNAALKSGRDCQRKGYDLAKIPAVVLEPENPADLLEMQLVENLARAEMTPTETARAVTRLMDSLDPRPSAAAMGARLGRSKAWVHQMLSLGSEEAQAVADYIGVPLESIGQTDATRLRGWMRDEDKRSMLDAIKSAVQMGDTLSRALVERTEEEFREQKEVAKEMVMGNETEKEIIRAFDQNGEEVDLSTIDLDNADSDEDINDGGAVDENGVYTGYPEEDAQNLDHLPEASLPNQVTVTLPRSLLERAFAKVGRELPGTMGTEEIIEALNRLLEG